MRLALGLALLGLLAGCADKPVRPTPPATEPAADAPRAAVEAGTAAADGVPPACVQVREHRDEDYTPGGLYAPGVSDSAPEHALDISGIPEPTPRDEPPAAYGNRSPYTVLGKSYRVRASAEGYVERGIASWYGQKFHGRQTSSREVYDMCSFSAAHKTLPLPSYVRVTNLDNGREVVVRVNDRGPFHAGRIIDLSYAAAVKLGVDRTGTARVEVRALTGGADLADAPAAVRTAPPMPAAATASLRGPQRIQVGAYRDRDNARRIVRQLQDAGIDDVGLEDVRTDAGKVWRVRIGPLAPAAVEGVLERIRRLGLPSPRVFSE
ncbi:MAG TPA: septal ring lytic transglycosylase RlpA family protein [Arenimonas sp.]|uniref:septal ring lytic transglycosylase RlpA family protein n=1 Tax=Arenimonas sp. TaxID=1872635 RepID=UPI002D7E32FA|nr:septal ring lytic transglycosylase RlpA family protein [Arenimonas sp.]HEU0152328.1 septal ring lytic transglycosylase RlpA family protein [Arenimonas sp.]